MNPSSKFWGVWERTCRGLWEESGSLLLLPAGSSSLLLNLGACLENKGIPTGNAAGVWGVTVKEQLLNSKYC